MFNAGKTCEVVMGSTKVTARRNPLGYVSMTMGPVDDIGNRNTLMFLFTPDQWAEMVAQVSLSDGMDFSKQVALEFHNTNFADVNGSASVQGASQA